MTALTVAKRAYREALSAILVSAAGGLLAGVVLAGIRDVFAAVEGLLVLLPALLATRGNVYGALGARVGTALHQGLLAPSVTEEYRRLAVLAGTALVAGLFASALAAVLAVGAVAVLPRPAASLPSLLAIAVISGVLSGLVLSVLVITVAIVGFRNGRNPDTLVGPVVTTAGDVVGVAFLFIAVRVVLLAGGG
jgi:mgtE-like transporter